MEYTHLAPFTRLATKRPSDWPVSPIPLLYLTPTAEGFPCADLRETLHGPPQMPRVQNRAKNIAEKFNRLSRVHERHGQTKDTIAVPLAEHNVVTFG